MGRSAARGIAGVIIGSLALTVMGAPSGSAATLADRRPAPKQFPGTGNLVRIQPLQVNGGARTISVAGKTIRIVSTPSGSLTFQLDGAAPFARVKPFTGRGYLASSGELESAFGRLLGPRPSLSVSYKQGGRTREFTATAGITPPVYDALTGSMRFQALGAQMTPIAASSVVVRFTATPPGATPGADTRARVRAKGPGQPYAVTFSSSTFLSPNTPPTMLSATQQTFPGNQCVKYSGTPSTGGQVTGVSQLTIEQTATQTSEEAASGTSVSAGYGGLSTSLTSSYTSSSSQDSASVYAVAKVAFAGIGTTLNPTIIYPASNVVDLSTALDLIAVCGDSVAVGYTSGAAYKAVLQMQTTSESQAESLSKSLEASYSSPSVSADASMSFSETVSSNSSVQNVKVTELCIGPSSCQAVSGYQAINTASVQASVDSFSSNFAAMQKGLATVCNSIAQASGCVVDMQYSPIENLVSGTLADSAVAKSQVSSASKGVYWLLTNAMAWASEYQSVATAYTQAATYQLNNVARYTQTNEQLNAQAASYQATASRILSWAGACSGTQVASKGCKPSFISCAEALAGGDTQAVACTPAGVSTLGVSQPAGSGPTLVAPAETCDAAIPAAPTEYNQVTTLYLGGKQSLSYPVLCSWRNGIATTYVQLTVGRSQKDGVTTNYSYGRIDPLTGALYTAAPDISWTPFATSTTQCGSGGCLPLGYIYATSGQGTSGPSFTVTLPKNLAFSARTNLSSSGGAIVTSPKQLGIPTGTWAAQQQLSGWAQLNDADYNGQGVVRLVSADGTSGASNASGVVAGARSACVGQTYLLNDGNSNNNPKITSVEAGYINGVPGACSVTVTYYSENQGNGEHNYSQVWVKTPSGGFLQPTFICAIGSNPSADTDYTYTQGAGAVKLAWYASKSYKTDPDITIKITYDNTYSPLPTSSQRTIYGMCPSTTTPVDGA